MRPFPRYTLAVMAAFVAFELWVPLLATVLRALAGPTVPTAVQVLASLLGLAVPTVVALALSDYLADRPGLVKPYQPKRRPESEAAADEHDEVGEEAAERGAPPTGGVDRAGGMDRAGGADRAGGMGPAGEADRAGGADQASAADQASGAD